MTDPVPSLPTAALALVCLSAGFLAATAGPGGEERVATARLGPGGEAFSVDLLAGETLHLEPEDGWKPAHVAVYGPDDELRAAGVPSTDDPLRARAAANGTFAVVPSGLDEGLDLSIEGTETTSTVRVDLLPVAEHERVLTSSEGDPVNATVPVSLDRAPALVGLRVDGTAEDLDLTLRSEEGTVFEAQADELDGTLGPADAPADAELAPSAVTPGVYRATVEADALDGEVALVHATYDRHPGHAHAANTSREGLTEMGVPVAGLDAGEAVHVPTDGIDRLRLVVGSDASATLHVYNPDHRVQGLVDLQPRAGYDWGFPQDQPAVVAASVPTPDDAIYTVYVAELVGADRANVLAPGERTVDPATEAPIEEKRVSVGGATASTSQAHVVETAVDGALVDIEAEVQALAARQHEVSVSGPLGNVFLYRAQNSVDGQPADASERENALHFSDGSFTVRVDESYAVDGGVDVILSSYQPPTPAEDRG